LGANDRGYRCGPWNLEGDESVTGFGKVESPPFDGVGDGSVAQNLLEVGAVHGESAAA
jgi:hypothetical protein